ncbi:MAG: hypothetical protein ACPLRU_07630, partial [Desulfofundulus sp.]
MKAKSVIGLMGLLVAILLLMTQCAPSTPPSTVAVQEPPTSGAPAAAASPSTGVTIKLIDTSEAHGMAFQKLASEFEKETGIRLEVEILPYEATYEKEVLTLST